MSITRSEADSSSTYGGPSYEEKHGIGLTVETALVVNMNKNAQFFGALDLAYKSYTDGKKVEHSSTTTTTAKLKKDTEQSISLTPLGLRLIL